MLSRRGVLGLALAGSGMAITRPVLAGLTPAGERRLAFYNLHTGEWLNSAYWVDGGYVVDELRSINYLLRDFRTGEVAPMDPNLIDLLYALRSMLGSREAFHVISGYRSVQTNAMLRAESGGVATHSLHVKGRAIDIRVPGRRLGDVRNAAVTLQRGGVGFYPASDFVHVDTGRVRHW
jgi:uncharacterized protein YcbK (DUF882 family)